MKPPVPLEKDECKTLVAYLRLRNIPHTHISNETGKGRDAKFMGIRNKQMGVSSGFPDYIIVLKDKLLFIEMKRVKGGSVSSSQKEWITTLEDAGQLVFVARGAEAAIKIIERHL